MSTVISTSWVARGAPRTATACAPNTNQGSARPSRTFARERSVSPSADIGRPVEQRFHPQVRVEVGATSHFIGPSRVRRSGRFVHLDAEMHFALDAQLCTITSREPLRKAPVAPRISSKIVSSQNHSRLDVSIPRRAARRRRPTATPTRASSATKAADSSPLPWLPPIVHAAQLPRAASDGGGLAGLGSEAACGCSSSSSWSAVVSTDSSRPAATHSGQSSCSRVAAASTRARAAVHRSPGSSAQSRSAERCMDSKASHATAQFGSSPTAASNARPSRSSASTSASGSASLFTSPCALAMPGEKSKPTASVAPNHER